MAKSTRTMYFAIKLVAATFGKQGSQKDSVSATTVTRDSTTKLTSIPATTVTRDSPQYASIPATTVTRDSLSMAFEDDAGHGSAVRVGAKPGTVFHGVAGHFTAHFLNFSDKDNGKCKTLAEAERLAKKEHKNWLADAYDWYVAPVEIGAASGGGDKAAKSAKPAKSAKAAKSVKRSKK